MTADLAAGTCDVFSPDLGLDPTGYHVFGCTDPQSDRTPWFMIPIEAGLGARVATCDRHAALFRRRYGDPPPPGAPPGSSPRIGPIANQDRAS
jgi:hypothetical protein